MENSYSLSSSDSSLEDMYQLPEGFKAHKVLGEGSFGVVLKCQDLKTNKSVAIKVAKGTGDLRQEAYMLRILMNNNLDQQNVIKFYDGFLRNKCLVFEMLDISLMDYLRNRKAPMRLQDIRTIIRQLATALDGLKNIGVIHADVKINNIMLVDHARQPFEVKLIDFGLATFRSMVKHKGIQQVPYCRAPEVMLDLPLSEAIDVWSLGCVMGIMVFGFPLFVGRVNYELLQHITDLVGPPPNQMISAGQRSSLYFKKTGSMQWALKTPEEYWGSPLIITDKRRYTFRCLDEMKMMRLEEDNMTEADEREECIELLKAMLMWDDKERITPSQILIHPFITMIYLNRSFCLGSCSTQETHRQTSGVIMDRPTAAVRLPSSLILVQHAPLQNRIPLGDTFDGESISTNDSGPARTTVLRNTNNWDYKEDNKAKRRKKRNCIRHFFSCFKKIVCSCCCVDDVAESRSDL